MPNPTVAFTQVGVQAITIYPWSPNATYSTTTAGVGENLQGLQNLDIGLTSTSVEGRGGESIWSIFSAEVARDGEVKSAAFKVTLRMVQLLLGGNLVVDLADGSGPEVQLWTPQKTDRSPYFRLVGQSSVGDGQVQIVIPKAKISGAFSYNMKMNEIIIPDFSAKFLFDSTYIRQDGLAGGAAMEMFYGDQGTLAQHS